jgi:ATP-dependent protease ClpP protease subunit
MQEVTETNVLKLTHNKKLPQFRNEVREQLQSADQSIRLAFDHEGGSLSVGIEIYQLLKSSHVPTVGTIIGKVNSASTIAFLGCSVRKISHTAVIGFHYPYWQVTMEIYENPKLMEENRNIALKHLETICAIYEKETMISRTTLKDLMSNKSILDADEAKRLGIVHEIEN